MLSRQAKARMCAGSIQEGSVLYPEPKKLWGGIRQNRTKVEYQESSILLLDNDVPGRRFTMHGQLLLANVW